MSVSVKDLYQESKDRYSLQLLTGDSGIRQTVSWIYVAEDIENMDFLRGRELIISTCMNCQSRPEWLLDFIRMLSGCHASGLIINTGKYITHDQITEEVLSLCREKHFPLLIMPWEVHIEDVTRDYCVRVLADRRNLPDMADAVKRLLNSEDLPEQAIRFLNRNGYAEEDAYTLALLTASAKGTTKSNMEMIRVTAERCPLSHHVDYLCLNTDSHILFLWHNSPAAVTSAHARELLDLFRKETQKDLFLVLSDTAAGLGSLKELYQQTLSALPLAQNSPSHYFACSEPGCGPFFSAIRDPDILQYYYLRNLGVLEEYDRRHDGALIPTLENYLIHQGRLNEVSEVMVCHKNTIWYRMNRIRDLLGMDLTDGEVCFRLMLALHIRNYLQGSDR